MSDGGLQIVAKLARLLRAIGSADRAGLSTSELARRTNLARPTAHRLLTSLLEQGLVDRNADTGSWLLGPELYVLGSVAASRYNVAEHASDILRHIANETGESAFLSAVRGSHTVCLLEEEGSFPLRSHVLRTGLRLPLGVASAGLVCLAFLPEPERERYLSDVDLSAGWGRQHSPEAIRRRVSATLRSGFALNPGLLVEGSWGLGAAVFDRAGRPAWAISITGVESRLRSPRDTVLGKALLEHAHALTQRVQALSPGGGGPWTGKAV